MSCSLSDMAWNGETKKTVETVLGIIVYLILTWLKPGENEKAIMSPLVPSHCGKPSRLKHHLSPDNRQLDFAILIQRD